MKKLIVYLKEYRLESILGPLFKLLEASFDLIVPLVMAAIIDKGIAVGDKSMIWKMGGLLVAFALVGMLCAFTAQYFSAKAAVGFASKVRYALFAHIQELSYADQDHAGVSTFITRLTSDINQIQNGLNLALRLLLRSPFIVFGAMIMAFTVNVRAALIFVVTIPVLSLVVFGVMLTSIPLFKKVQTALDGVLGTTRENLTGSRVIRAFNKEADETEIFDEKNEMLRRLQLYVGKISAIMSPVTYVIINVATLILLWSGAIKVDRNILTQGQVIALVNYMSQILIELVKLANLIIQINKALACANRVQAVLDIEPSQTFGTLGENKTVLPAGAFSLTPDTVVAFQHACLTYPGAGAESLTDINLRVMKGQTIGIIGGTGAGKTSVVNMIPRFYDATDGEVRVEEQPVQYYTKEALRAKIGLVPQNARLFKGTIRENLLWGNPDATEEDLLKALEIAQARDFVEQKEGGLDAEVEQNGRNLSGGQRQRLTIARALVRQPEILILDDSASALDFATDARLRQALSTLDPKPTIFIVSQRTSSIMHADQILVLDDGAQVGLGTHEELLEKCAVYQEIYYSQFPKKEHEPSQDSTQTTTEAHDQSPSAISQVVVGGEA